MSAWSKSLWQHKRSKPFYIANGSTKPQAELRRWQYMETMAAVAISSGVWLFIYTMLTHNSDVFNKFLQL